MRYITVETTGEEMSLKWYHYLVMSSGIPVGWVLGTVLSKLIL